MSQANCPTENCLKPYGKDYILWREKRCSLINNELLRSVHMLYCMSRLLGYSYKTLRTLKIHLGKSSDELAVKVAMWEFRSHYVIAMSRRSKCKERERDRVRTQQPL